MQLLNVFFFICPVLFDWIWWSSWVAAESETPNYDHLTVEIVRNQTVGIDITNS